MNRFEWFEAGQGRVGVELGIVRPDIFMKFIRYKVFLDFLSQGYDKGTAMELTAERNHCSRLSIYRAIAFFQVAENKT